MWLLDDYTRNNIEAAELRGEVLPEPVEALAPVSVKRGRTAFISVKGVLTKDPSPLARLFGGGNTTYTRIIQALASADADPGITDITMTVDSPGGNMDGLFETAEAVRNVSKPVRVEASLAASAAYGLIAHADEIVATGPAARFGNIGVVKSIKIDEKAVEVTSTAAPKKRPDVRTEEGVAMVREELDVMHQMFAENIAAGRGVSVDDVNANFGEGGTLYAEQALSRGMIDGIMPPAQTKTEKEVKSMDLQTLKANHPEVYAEACAEGTAQERDRVVAHLTMGQGYGALPTAIEAVADGSTMTMTLQAQYLTAGRNRDDIQARQDDNIAEIELEPVVDAAERLGDMVLQGTADVMGIELEGE